jgi:hypothetical protein
MKHVWSFLKAVSMRFKYLLGGGSLLVVAVGIIEHYVAASISWTIYTWILAAVFFIALVSHGAYLQSRLEPKMQIKQPEKRIWPIGQHGFTGAEFYFEILNKSESEPLENVRVELISMHPDAIHYLPVPLHIKHDSYEIREFCINAGATRQIDLITGPVNHPKSQRVMVVAHTVNADRVNIPYGRYRMTVRVSAKNSAPATAVFEAWIDSLGELACVML